MSIKITGPVLSNSNKLSDVMRDYADHSIINLYDTILKVVLTNRKMVPKLLCIPEIKPYVKNAIEYVEYKLPHLVPREKLTETLIEISSDLFPIGEKITSYLQKLPESFTRSLIYKIGNDSNIICKRFEEYILFNGAIDNCFGNSNIIPFKDGKAEFNIYRFEDKDIIVDRVIIESDKYNTVNELVDKADDSMCVTRIYNNPVSKSEIKYLVSKYVYDKATDINKAKVYNKIVKKVVNHHDVNINNYKDIVDSLLRE